MSSTNKSDPFEELPIPRQDIGGMSSGKYRVYKDAKDFILVDADTALEAFQASGLPTVYKIERDTIDFNRVLDLRAWVAPPKSEGDATAASAEPAAAESAAEQTPPPQ